MQKNNFMKICLIIIIFTILFIIITEGIDEDLWKDLKSSTSRNLKKPKFSENLSIKEEIDVKNEINEQQNANKVVIKSENCDENETEDIKPKVSQKIKKEPLDGHNNKLKIKIKLPKIESVKWNGEALENENDEQQADQINNTSADQNNSSVDHSNCSADDDEESDYTETNVKRRNGLEKNAKKLGKTHNKIYNLKQKMGQIKKKKRETAETKMELIRAFDQMRKEKIYGFKYEAKQRQKIEREIAESLGVNRNKMYELKNEFGLIKKFTKSQQIEKIKQFESVKRAFSQKFNLSTNWKIEKKIAGKIGVLYSTIYDWKRKFGLISSKKKSYTNAEKLEYVKNYEKIEKRNPKLSKEKIAEELGIPRTTLKRWIKQLSNN